MTKCRSIRHGSNAGEFGTDPLHGQISRPLHAGHAQRGGISVGRAPSCGHYGDYHTCAEARIVNMPRMELCTESKGICGSVTVGVLVRTNRASSALNARAPGTRGMQPTTPSTSWEVFVRLQRTCVAAATITAAANEAATRLRPSDWHTVRTASATAPLAVGYCSHPVQ